MNERHTNRKQEAIQNENEREDINIDQKLAARYQFGHFFPELLEKLAARLSERQDLQKVVIENLEEETGKNLNYPGPEHGEGRKKLLQALGINYAKWEPKGSFTSPQNVNPATAKVLRIFAELIDNPNPVVGYGAVAQSEAMVAEQYRTLVGELEKEHPGLPRESLAHLLSHIEHDDSHGAEMFQALNATDEQAAAEGAGIAKKAWEQFWKDLET